MVTLFFIILQISSGLPISWLWIILAIGLDIANLEG